MGNRALGDKFSRSKEIQERAVTRMERELILLSPVQREVFRRLETREHLQHFFFVGGSGTGKTQMSLLTIQSLVKRYTRRNPTGQIFLYLTYRQEYPGQNLALQETFERFVTDKLRGRNLSVKISALESLGKLFSKYLGKICDFVIPACEETLSLSGDVETFFQVKKKHPDSPVIFFIDENNISSAQRLSSTVNLKNLQSFHFISAFSPIVDNVVRLKNNGFDFEDRDIVIQQEDRMWVNLHLRYRNTRAVQNLCRDIGKSLR